MTQELEAAKKSIESALIHLGSHGHGIMTSDSMSALALLVSAIEGQHDRELKLLRKYWPMGDESQYEKAILECGHPVKIVSEATDIIKAVEK
jgi:hypothetical protein